ncbi:MAG: HNH endonuclease [Deltaproteobacteria bacterium]|nr:HNH endonuclease [Deltaproteobacteria bacterium]
MLDAAHIQPYVGAKSNHIQNGLLLTKEFHALFDRGYVTVTPDLEVRVSTRLKSEWKNGKRYYPCDGERLVVIPGSKSERPSSEALKWHNNTVFRTG